MKQKLTREQAERLYTALFEYFLIPDATAAENAAELTEDVADEDFNVEDVAADVKNELVKGVDAFFECGHLDRVLAGALPHKKRGG